MFVTSEGKIMSLLLSPKATITEVTCEPIGHDTVFQTLETNFTPPSFPLARRSLGMILVVYSISHQRYTVTEGHLTRPNVEAE